MIILFAFLLLFSAPAFAAPLDEARAAKVVFLGEIHDNPAHHATQAEWVAALKPRALVFEMLTPAMAKAAANVPPTDAAALEAATGWAESGWPDFALYAPIFAAAPKAKLYGAAVPRAAAREAMTQGVATTFGPDAPLYGLNLPLDPTFQAAAEEEQSVAHCNALPPDMLGPMVEVQRLRDATLARAARQAIQETGGPVVVITGNGHARLDRAAPAALRVAEPDLAVFSLGQSEAGAIFGAFDAVIDAPPATRDDPCKAFR